MKEASLHLVTFDTTDLDVCLAFLKRDVYNCRNHGHVKVQATGVGCMKHRDRISNTLGVEYVYLIKLISNVLIVQIRVFFLKIFKFVLNKPILSSSLIELVRIIIT